MKRVIRLCKFSLLLITATSVCRLEAQTHRKIPVGDWVDREGIVAIAREGANQFSLTVVRKGKGNYTHGTGNVIEQPQKNSRRREGETVLSITLRRGKNKFPQIGYYDPVKDTLRFKGGMVWTRHFDQEALARENERLRLQNAQLRANLKWRNQLVERAQFEMRRQRLTGKNVKAISYMDETGNFGTLLQNANGVWLECNSWGEVVHQFKAVRRTNDSVILHDVESASHIDLKIDLKACKVTVFKDEKVVETYAITGAGGGR